MAVVTAGALTTALVACGGDKKSSGGFPANFSKIGDQGRVEYMLRKVSPDSLARFIIYSTLGRVEGSRIDTLAIATNYAYERLKGDALDKFGAEYDNVINSLSLGDKMHIYANAGTEDPQGLGYRLGLEYVSSIRDNRKSVADIEKELQEFRKACAADTATYRRFIIGFRTVLQVDSGKDLPRDVYNRFIDIQ